MDLRNRNYISEMLYALIAIIPLIIVPFIFDRFYLPKIIFVYLFIITMFLFYIISKNRVRLENDLISIALMIYWMTLFISTAFSIDPFTSIWGRVMREEGLFALLAYGILFLVAKTFFKHSDKNQNWLILSSVLVAAYGISQYFRFDPIPRDSIRLNWVGRAFSTIGNPNFLGSYLVLFLPLSVFSYLKDRKIISLITSSIIYLCLLLTFTRSALLGFAVILVFMIIYALLKKTTWKSLSIILLVFAIITVAVNIKSDNHLSNRFTSIGKEAKTVIQKNEGYEKAGANRIFIWIRAVGLIKERPLVGFGLENMGVAFTQMYIDDIMETYGIPYDIDKAHNEYLHIAVTSGIPALISYLAFIGLSLLKGLKNVKVNTNYFPFICSVVAYLAQAFFNVSVVSVAFIYWAFLGIITNERAFEK